MDTKLNKPTLINGLWLTVVAGVMIISYKNHSSNQIAPANTVIKYDKCINTDKSFSCIEFVEAIDGDTIKVNIKGQHPFFGLNTSVRLYGIDSPETHSTDACEKTAAQESKAFTQGELAKAKRIDLTGIDRDKYGRILAHVIYDGKDLSDAVIKSDHAYPYFGDKKVSRNWCK